MERGNSNKKPVMERGKKLLSKQIKKKITKEPEILEGYFPGTDGNISTGSTLLDLCISGGRIRGGGLPGGILVEIFGPNGSGKTVLASQIAGNIQLKGGDVKFHDPEARLNPTFAKMFGLELQQGNYHQPDTVPEIFETVKDWKPKGKGIIHGVIADSLAALSTSMEMEKKEGDKMGGRRAKEFSEGLRKTCRILKQNNYLMVCTNQIRQNFDAGPFGQKYTTPGGEAVGFYSSCRLRTSIISKVKKVVNFHGEKVQRIIGVDINVEIYKNSIWKPYHVAPVTIIFDYGIDDIRQNLKFLKEYSNKSVYFIGNDLLDKSIEKSIKMIEDAEREEELRQEVILLWNKIETQFDSDRKPKNP